VTLEVKVMKEVEYTFCMKQFKPAIVVLAILVVFILGWVGWHCAEERVRAVRLPFIGSVKPAAAALRVTAPPIRVKDKMIHPYWGNCNKCHVTINAGKPVSKVMVGAPISINDKAPHKYWGNCLLCHKVIAGLQPKKKTQRAKAAALNKLVAGSLGLKIRTVTAAMMQKFGLTNEDGVLVLEVSPNSLADRAGLRKGDEIIRVGKTRVETAKTFEMAINGVKPGKSVKINIYRGKKDRNLILRIPKDTIGMLTPAAATAPMTQNQIETLAEQLGVPKTQQTVTRALQRQKQGKPVVNLYHGKVAFAAMGPGLGYQASPQFGASPYFVIFDPQINNYEIVANPNANDATGRGVQTAQYMVDLGAGSVVAGNFSQNALHSLHILRMNAYAGVTGSVRNVLSSYNAGRLVLLNTDPNLRAAGPQRNTYPDGSVLNGQPIY
jgi:predicted Fe-Mo cluster-binding NifX family protein